MVNASDDKLVEKIRSLRDHGAVMSDFQRHQGSKPYLLAGHPYAGYNYRMNDIQASLGTTQMDRAETILSERQVLAKKYDKSILDLDFFQLPYRHPDYEHGYQSYPCVFDKKNLSLKNVHTVNKKRNAFMQKLQSAGVSTRPATHAVHMLTYYKEKYGSKPKDFPNAYIANECSISFPLFNGMTEEELAFVLEKIKQYTKDFR